MRLDLQLGQHRVRVNADDAAGGALPTGTLIREDIYADIQELPVDPVVHQQGIETRRIFDAWCIPLDLSVRPRDLMEVLNPPTHPFYGRRFTVLVAGLPSGHALTGIGFYEMRLQLRDYARED